jgi:hypothetical protein
MLHTRICLLHEQEHLLKLSWLAVQPPKKKLLLLNVGQERPLTEAGLCRSGFLYRLELRRLCLLIKHSIVSSQRVFVADTLLAERIMLEDNAMVHEYGE